jgi:hypothetical protein
MKCNGCGIDAEPIVEMLPSGQLGRMCGSCHVPFGMALTPPNAAFAAEDEHGRRTKAVVAFEAAKTAAPATPKITNGHAVHAPLRRTTPAPREPRAPSGDSPADILQARLDDAEAEIAHLEIEASRLVGLRAEAKHLRKQLAAAQTRERVTKALAATPAEPPPQTDLFAKN